MLKKIVGIFFIAMFSNCVSGFEDASSSAFREYKTNYLLGSLDGGHNQRREPFSDCDLKFQISFMKPLHLPDSASEIVDENVSSAVIDALGTFNFSYSQKSFWDICRNSGPFSESNYNPALFWTNSFILDGYSYVFTNAYGYEHESNGQEYSQSRSWDRLWYQQNIAWGGTQTFGRISESSLVEHYAHELSAKAWYIAEREWWNADIDDYLGHVEVFYAWTSPNFRASMTARKRSYEVNLFLYSFFNNLSNSGNFAWQLQYFYGYGESLQMYNVKSSTIRFGVAFTY